MKNSLMGLKAEDRITGFTGFITGIASYITGCDQYLLQPKTKKQAYVKGIWFDENRIIVDIDADGIFISDLVAPIELEEEPTGFPARRTGGPRSNTAPAK